jgi:hypothetical protein
MVTFDICRLDASYEKIDSIIDSYGSLAGSPADTTAGEAMTFIIILDSLLLSINLGSLPFYSLKPTR